MTKETSLQLMRTSSNDIQRGNKEQTSSRTNTDGKVYVKHHIPGQKTNILVREKTNVTEQVRRRNWTWAGHVSRTRDNRWTGTEDGRRWGVC